MAKRQKATKANSLPSARKTRNLHGLIFEKLRLKCAGAICVIPIAANNDSGLPVADERLQPSMFKRQFMPTLSDTGFYATVFFLSLNM
jgi:hypothetical protein